MAKCEWCGRYFENGCFSQFCSEKCHQEYEDRRNADSREKARMEAADRNARLDRESRERIAKEERESRERAEREERTSRENAERKNRELRKAQLQFEREKERVRRQEWESNINNWDGDKWCAHLAAHPADAFQCDWKKLKGTHVAKLLSSHPEFADKFDWAERLTGSDWATLLCNQPQFSDKCNWTLLSPHDFAEVISCHSQFADKCTWSDFDGEDWPLILKNQPQFSGKGVKWEDIDPDDWAMVLAYQPQFEDKFEDWDQIENATRWGLLLRSQPQFCSKSLAWIVKFNDEVDDDDEKTNEQWRKLLEVHPQFLTIFEKVSSLDVFGGDDWALLLKNQLEWFWERCNHYKLRKCDWKRVIEHLKNDGDANGKWIEKVSAKRDEIYAIIDPFLRKADKEDLELLDVDEWLEILITYPQLAVRFCDWGDLDEYGWKELLSAQPRFSKECDDIGVWDKLWNGEEGAGFLWSELLNAQPQLIDKCDVDNVLSSFETYQINWKAIFKCPVLCAKCVEAGRYGDLIEDVLDSIHSDDWQKHYITRDDFSLFDEESLIEMLKLSPNELPRWLTVEKGWGKLTEKGWNALIRFDEKYIKIKEKWIDSGIASGIERAKYDDDALSEYEKAQEFREVVKKYPILGLLCKNVDFIPDEELAEDHQSFYYFRATALAEVPELLDRCIETIDEDDWIRIIERNPMAARKCRVLNKIDARGWVKVLCAAPELINKCKIVNQFDKNDWCTIISAQCSLLKYCPIKEDLNWQYIIAENPDALRDCPIKLNESDWLHIIEHRPEMLSSCPCVDEFDASDWTDILRAQPQLATDTRAKFPGNNKKQAWLWSWLLSDQPNFAAMCSSWKYFDKRDWKRLSEKQPQYKSRYFAFMLSRFIKKILIILMILAGIVALLMALTSFPDIGQKLPEKMQLPFAYLIKTGYWLRDAFMGLLH